MECLINNTIICHCKQKVNTYKEIRHNNGIYCIFILNRFFLGKITGENVVLCFYVSVLLPVQGICT